MTAPALELQNAYEGAAWLPSEALVTRWLSAALPSDKADSELTVRLVNNTESQQLNRDYRGKDKPTNVLSFPADTEGLPEGMDAPLGDIALAWGVTSREAAERQISAAAHTTHLVVHGLVRLA